MTTIQPNLAITRQDNCKAAVLFLHGFDGHLVNTWEKFPYFLAADKRLDGWDIFSLGYATRLAFDVSGIWKADPPLISVADLLRAHAATAPLKTYEALALIAHSMGGLVVQRALLDDHEFANRVSHLILFGTPSDGLKKARFFRFWKRQIKNMAEGGTFVTDLRQRWDTTFPNDKDPPFKFLTIAGDQDEFVPRKSSIDPFPQRFRQVVEGNHLEIVKPATADNLGVRLVLDCLTKGTVSGGPANAAAVAVESRNFQQAIDILWPNRQALDKVAAVQLALALDGVGRPSDAIDVLKNSRHQDDTDAMGVLAGRLKRRWIVERVDDDAKRARELYAKGYELSADKSHAQAFYHGINVAFLDLVYSQDAQQARKMAAQALQHCAQAERDIWCVATEAEAYLYLGEFDSALKRYSEVLALNLKPWQVRSIYKQAVLVARHLKNPPLEKQFIAAFESAGA